MLGAYLVAEGWAEPVPFDAPDGVAELEPDRDQSELPNLRREFYPPYYDGPPSFALDRRRRRRGG